MFVIFLQSLYVFVATKASIHKIAKKLRHCAQTVEMNFWLCGLITTRTNAAIINLLILLNLC